jgi:hypothetical protein
MAIRAGSPTPRQAKMMWKASEMPIWARPAMRSLNVLPSFSELLSPSFRWP